MVVVIALLIALLTLIGQGGPGMIPSEPQASPFPAGGSIRVTARACQAGVTSAQASADRCPIWADGAAIQATDLKGNAWGMNASRDATLPGNPVIYSLDGLAFGTYLLGAPTLPAGFSGFFIDGAQLTTGGQPQVELTSADPHAEITVFFLKSA